MVRLFEKRFMFLAIPIFFGLVFFPFIAYGQTATTSLSVTVSVCGNGFIDGAEDCDGSDLGGQTCVGLGYDGGTLSCKADCTFDLSGCSEEAPFPTGLSSPPSEKTYVILEGIAYPEASIDLLIDGELFDTTKADSEGYFNIKLVDLTPGLYNFGLQAEDNKGRKSITFSFSSTVSRGVTTNIRDILMPPTIELEKTSVEKGDFLNISGQSAPGSEISIFFEPGVIFKKSISDQNGDWSYSFNTGLLERGLYSVKAKSVSSKGLKSSFSKILDFGVSMGLKGELCFGADFNKDGKVDLVDFSILLYWWNRYDLCVDQNQDGIVNLEDFSILMYYWTG